ncbi:hypothetical protein Tco_0414978 [Tanacetum coccineum]
MVIENRVKYLNYNPHFFFSIKVLRATTLLEQILFLHQLFGLHLALEARLLPSAYAKLTTYLIGTPAVKNGETNKSLSAVNLSFNGTEGEIGLIRWFEHSTISSILDEADVLEENKVTFGYWYFKLMMPFLVE